MDAKNLNYRLVKIHRNCIAEEAAELLGVHKNTVRAWVKAGLQIVDELIDTVSGWLGLHVYIEDQDIWHPQELFSHLYLERQDWQRLLQSGV